MNVNKIFLQVILKKNIMYEIGGRCRDSTDSDRGESIVGIMAKKKIADWQFYIF